MKGTFAFCRTREALKRLDHGDILQRISTEEYYKKEKGKILKSPDTFHWIPTDQPIESFPPFEDWKSLSNLHYYDDLKLNDPEAELIYLTEKDRIVDETNPQADRTKKRWFLKSLWS